MKIKPIKSKLCFVKINVINGDALDFYKKFFEYFGYKVEKTHDRNYMWGATNGGVNFLFDNSFNINQEINLAHLISGVGSSGIHFRAEEPGVKKYIKNFLTPHNIKPTHEYKSEKTGLHGIDVYNIQKENISVFSYPKNSKDRRNKQLGFNNLGIRAINENSLLFYKDLLTYLRYKQTREWGGSKKDTMHEFALCNAQTEFNVFINETGKNNTEGSMIEFLRSGVDTLFFKVKDKKAVEQFQKEFLKPRKINFRFKNPNLQEEGNYSVFFNSPEGITIGILAE